jgi:hypothetical protein
MLRHKAMVQCARICFGLSGIYEPDEASRIESVHQSKGDLSVQKQPIRNKNPNQSTTTFVKNWIHEVPRGTSFKLPATLRRTLD